QVLVAGASGGVGGAVVRSLVQSGSDVLAIVRRPEEARQLLASYDGAVHPLLVDITDQDSLDQCQQQLEVLGPIDALVNCAGGSLPGALMIMPPADLRAQLELNLIAQVALVQTALPGLRRGVASHGSARVVMIGSIAGRATGALLGAYSTAKYGLVAATTALRCELAHEGIGVTLLEPGSIKTGLWAKNEEALERLRQQPDLARLLPGQLRRLELVVRRGARSGMSPDAVALAVQKALTSKRPPADRLIGRDARVIAALQRHLPRRVMDRLLRG
ncbi:MAG: SDR family NAD(P)-dependent oxidoreductase, partial [Propionibacteriaceae bacterium]